ncbi:MAG: indole-3-glycerol phosphate synthase TrpC [Candidatus Mycalebacterium zealandia]|nr:MAG: indole-3-glycerol phosphate synthase TrpC [Candidatus Mycalebacterium zealandia]
MATSILTKIIENKKTEITELKKRFSLSEIKDLSRNAPAAKNFRSALLSGTKPRVIAEIKKASPSKGIIAKDFNPVSIAAQYEQSGAAAVSVLTDQKFFQGSLSYIAAIKHETSLPVLRKDFLIDPFQIYESRVAEADTLLLIVAAMENTGHLSDLLGLSRDLGMEPLVEVHTESEVEMALEAKSSVVGINNRDLDSFKVDLSVSERLASMIGKDKVIVAESGITSSNDMISVSNYGVHAFLIGETLMSSPEPGQSLQNLMRGWRQ